jgi:hypothetical protein
MFFEIFFQFYFLAFYSIWFFNPIWSLYFWFLYFRVLYFSWLLFICKFIPSNFIVYFLIRFDLFHFVLIPYLVCIVWVFNCFTVVYFTWLFFHGFLPTRQFVIENCFFFRIHNLTFYCEALRFIFCSTFLSVVLSRSHISGNRLVNLTIVDSNFFPQFVFIVYSSTLNYWLLSYVIFSLFFLLGYPKCGLVKLTRVSLYFSYSIILFNFGLFC